MTISKDAGKLYLIWKRNTTNWRFETQLKITLKNNTIRCKKLAKIVSGRKNVAWPLVRQKQLNTKCAVTLLSVAVKFRHSCLPVFAWRRVVLRFSTRNNCYSEFLAFYSVITQSVIQSFLKTPICGASLSLSSII